jgi:hypothetical protein
MADEVLTQSSDVTGLSRSQAEGGVPHVMLGVKAPDFVQFDLSVLCLVYGFAGNPPLRAGQTSRQDCASPGIVSLLRSAPPGGNFAMGRLPEPDSPRLAADHNGVVPPFATLPPTVQASGPSALISASPR